MTARLMEALERRLLEADALELDRVNGVHGRLDVTRAEIADAVDRLTEQFQAAEQVEQGRVNGVHGRLDVTRAEFADTVVRLTEHVGESHHRMALITAEVQRATDLFDLKLAALEAQAERSLEAVGQLLFKAGGEVAGRDPSDQELSRNGSERDSA
jgi:hypothetical protein